MLHPFILMDEKPHWLLTLLGDAHVWLEIFVNVLSVTLSDHQTHEAFMTYLQ